MKKISVRFISLGCPKNLVDSEVMLGYLQRDQFTILSPNSQSDVVVVNTCGFIEDAKQESINTLLELAREKKEGRLKLLVAAGCLSQRYAQELPGLLPEVDAFIGTGDFSRLATVIHNKLGGKKTRNYVEYPHELPVFNTPRYQSTSGYSRYIKIAEGCSHSCSFCIIPKMRGGLKSRPSDDIVKEMRAALNRGTKEFNLISQDLNEYGRDLKSGESLYQLLSKLESLQGNLWIRLLYMYPLQFPDKLIRLIRDHPHLVKYVDIPLQHIDNALLRSMRRGSSSRYIYRLIEKLKSEVPGIIIRTTFIAGYPGETDTAFSRLVDFVRNMEFDRVGIFTFSREEETPSYHLEGQLPEKIKNERCDILMKTQQKVSLEKNKRLIGKTLKVLYEGSSSQSEFLGSGRFYGQAPDIDGEVLIRSGTAKLGEFVDVKIVDAFEYDLLGEIVTPKEFV